MMSEIEIISRLAISFVLGGLIGLERQIHRRAAGLRTHILVCVGSCLMMIISIYMFEQYKNTANVDPSRIAANVVTGIGFLGAGAIMRENERIKGLTTAATLWLIAGIGLAIGCGFYLAGVVSTVLALLSLLFLGRMERQLLGKDAN